MSARGPLLFADIETEGLRSIDTYRKGGGYEMVKAWIGGRSRRRSASRS
jgi:hypothetical protein